MNVQISYRNQREKEIPNIKTKGDKTKKLLPKSEKRFFESRYKTILIYNKLTKNKMLF